MIKKPEGEVILDYAGRPNVMRRVHLGRRQEDQDQREDIRMEAEIRERKKNVMHLALEMEERGVRQEM